MQSIEIDSQVFSELARRATGFHVTPNDVLRRLLGLLEPLGMPKATVPTDKLSLQQRPGPHATLLEFVRSENFQRHNQAVERYLAILSWLHSTHAQKFSDAVTSFRRGNRLYFARTEREILQSGENVTAKVIPQSPFWALVTLDNRTKRQILEDVLRTLAYPRGDINTVLTELPDSGIRRLHD